MNPETFFDNFGLLADTPNGVQKLRELILQLAVQGKLVPQDPNDEPAAVLLEKIKAEKARLVKEKKIRKPKPLPPIDSEQIIYKLPEEWVVVRLNEVVSLKSGITLDKKMEVSKGGIPYLKVGDMNLQSNETEITTSSRFVEETDKIKKYLIPKNSILFPKRGGAIATNKKRIVRANILADSNTMAICCCPNVYLEYLFYWFLQVDLWALNSGTSVPQINNKDIAPLLFQMPPLNEQKRIVAKVDQLMALCDNLESKLKQSQTDGEKLMEAVVAELIGA